MPTPSYLFSPGLSRFWFTRSHASRWGCTAAGLGTRGRQVAAEDVIDASFQLSLYRSGQSIMATELAA
jgi:hypothetical protein